MNGLKFEDGYMDNTQKRHNTEKLAIPQFHTKNELCTVNMNL